MRKWQKLGENDVFGGNGRNSNKISNEMEKVAILARMAYLAKMAEMANKRQIVNKVPNEMAKGCLLYTSPSPRDGLLSRMPSSA